MSKKDIEDLFKDKFENFEAEVSPSVWSNIKTGLKGAGLGLLGKTILNKIGTNALVAVISSAVTVVGTVGVMNYTGYNANKSETANKSSKAISIEKQTAEPVSPIKMENKESKKPAIAANIDNDKKPKANEQPMQETKIAVKPFHKDKNEMQDVINTFSEIPVASIFASPIGGTVPLIVNLSNTGSGTTNNWKYSDGKKEDKVANPVHVFENPGVYTVTLTSTDAQGKTSEESIKINVTGNSSMAPVPRELTPNGDGINDVFNFEGKNIVKLTGIIFDNTGHIYYECSGPGKWDGKDSRGQEVKAGKYYFIEKGEGVDGKSYRNWGIITLAR